METLKKYSQFKKDNPLKKDKWEPDTMIVVPDDSDYLLDSIKTTFHSTPVNLNSLRNRGVLKKSEFLDLETAKPTNPVFLETNPAKTIRETFSDLSQLFFKRGTLADSFFKFNDICQDLNIDYAAVAGACTYYYWGGWPIYDIDVVVPDERDLQKLASAYGNIELQKTESGIGKMKYLNLGDIDALTDLELKYADTDGVHRRQFTYDELVGDLVVGNLFGEKFNMASPMATVLLKLYLGRFGVDQWGIAKDDYEDGLGVLVAKKISFEELERQSTNMQILERIKLGKQIAGEVLGIR